MKIQAIEDHKVENQDYYPVTLITDFGKISCRYYMADVAKTALICVDGVGGEWDTPANDLYPKLGLALKSEGLNLLRIKYRNSINLNKAIQDIAAGIAFLQQKYINSIGLIGHSFGGAAVIQAASLEKTNHIKAIITLASQSYGADRIDSLGHCAKLFIHGDKDEILPPQCSLYLYGAAHEPKQLIIYKGATHSLNNSANDIFNVIKN